MLKRLFPEAYNVFLISPDNYCLFTPLLASAAVGTVELHSILEPIRRITQSCGADYFCAQVVDVKPQECTVTCRPVDGRGDFSLEYDRLVIAVGAEVNTFNIPRVEEYTLKLKNFSDARKIRRQIALNFDLATNPTISPSEKQRLFTSIFVGGGPTGVEFAAELCDLIEQDFRRLYPAELVREANVILIQSSDHILSTYDLRISQYAERLFKRQGVRVLNNHQVTQVTKEQVECMDKTGKTILRLPRGLCVWATGIRMIPLVHDLTGKLPEQTHDRALVVDDWLRIKGTENIFAMGIVPP